MRYAPHRATLTATTQQPGNMATRAALPACFSDGHYTPEAATRWANTPNVTSIDWPARCRACPATGAISVHSNPVAAGAPLLHGGGRRDCAHSQEGQELLVASLLARDSQVPRGLTYLEMGGGDGSSFSNTYFFEACFGWRGILVEANPSLSHELCRSRPRALAFSFAACSETQGSANFTVPLRFKRGQPPKGAKPCGNVPMAKCSTWGRDPTHGWVRGYFAENWVLGGAVQKRTSKATPLRHTSMRVPCASLSAMLGDAYVAHLDYLSLDVEGSEAVALNTLDWERLSIHCVGVEQSASALEKNAAVRTILSMRGFVHVATLWIWDGHVADEFYLNETYLEDHLWQVAQAVRLPKSQRAQLSIASPMATRRIFERAARRARLFPSLFPAAARGGVAG